MLAISMPYPVKVHTDAMGQPLALVVSDTLRPVAAIRDQWRVDDRWKWDAITRRYYHVLLGDGSERVVFQDLDTGQWFEQGC